MGRWNISEKEMKLLHYISQVLQETSKWSQKLCPGSVSGTVQIQWGGFWLLPPKVPLQMICSKMDECHLLCEKYWILLSAPQTNKQIHKAKANLQQWKQNQHIHKSFRLLLAWSNASWSSWSPATCGEQTLWGLRAIFIVIYFHSLLPAHNFNWNEDSMETGAVSDPVFSSMSGS